MFNFIEKDPLLFFKLLDEAKKQPKLLDSLLTYIESYWFTRIEEFNDMPRLNTAEKILILNNNPIKQAINGDDSLDFCKNLMINLFKEIRNVYTEKEIIIAKDFLSNIYSAGFAFKRQDYPKGLQYLLQAFKLTKTSRFNGLSHFDFDIFISCMDNTKTVF